jgi:hypothetical protein
MPGNVLIGAEAALDHCFDDNGREPPSACALLGSPMQAHPALVGR